MILNDLTEKNERKTMTTSRWWLASLWVLSCATAPEVKPSMDTL